MVARFLFKDRDGRTPLPENFKKDLIPIHVKLSAELDEVEEANIVDGLIWLADQTSEATDWMFWMKLHRKMFEKVWQWAGKFRVQELENEDFCYPSYIQENIRRLEGDIRFWLKAETKMDKKEAMARFHERFLTIHPFSNGNGRTARILTTHICRQKSLPVPTWGTVLRKSTKKHREIYIEAVKKARHSYDFSSLVKFMYS